MVGVILAGGLGTRLMPLTKITNKHLLPVYDQPMIFYPIKSLVQAGIKDIVLVTGGAHSGSFVQLLGNGKEFGLSSLQYVYQDGEGGIADALRLTQRVTRDSPIAVILGDNLFEKSIAPHVQSFQKNPQGAQIVLKKVKDPNRFGVPSFDKKNNIIKITEKPKHPDSPYAVTGLYFYDSEVFKIISKLKPSRRGELEITDVNNAYLNRGQLKHGIISGWWSDCGTFKSLHNASTLIKKQLSK
ncbi:MAG: NTP transferase domain-containing protein [Candidatus Omnitrophica bacterium]|nr:NTP transferase domain-containing protein [Candidatus Omnitrophota bacterium]